MTFFSTKLEWTDAGICWGWSPSRLFFCKLSSLRFLRISTIVSSRRLRPSSASTATLYRFRRTSVLEFPLGRYDIVSEAIDGKTVRTTKKQSTGPRGVEELGNLTVGFGIYMDTESERERERDFGFLLFFCWVFLNRGSGKWKVYIRGWKWKQKLG